MKGFCVAAAAASALVCAPVCAAHIDTHRLPAVVIDTTPARPLSEEMVLDAPVDPWSARESEAVTFANGLTVRARAVFADPNLDQAGRRAALGAIVAEAFDIDGLGRMLLGENRGRLTQQQQSAYQTAVAGYLVPLYAGRLYNVSGASPEVVSVDEQERGVSVRMAYSTAPNEPKTIVDWLIDPRADGSWRVLDIAFNGVSVAQAKMDEFAAVLRNQGPDALLERLHIGAGDRLPPPLASAADPPNSPPRPRLHVY